MSFSSVLFQKPVGKVLRATVDMLLLVFFRNSGRAPREDSARRKEARFEKEARLEKCKDCESENI